MVLLSEPMTMQARLFPRTGLCLLFVAVLGLTSGPAASQVTFSIATEPGTAATIGPLTRTVELNLLAAAQSWGENLEGKCTIEIAFKFDVNANAGRGSGSSVTTHPAGKRSQFQLYEQGMAAEIRSGIDPNGLKPDVSIVLHPHYFKTMWIDPDPSSRRARVPSTQLDAVSVFLHELGHALAFNGWLDPATGVPPRNELSTYDQFVRFDGGEFWFHGPGAVKIYGRPVPLGRTHNNYHHVANRKGAPGFDLRSDLMNGIMLDYGTRYYISRLDLAMLADTGLSIKQ